MADKTVKLTGSRSFQDIGTIGSTTEQLSGNIQSINANLDVGLRNTKNIIDSFLRVSDLVALGLVSLDGNMLSAAPAAVTAVITVADSIVGDGSVATPLKLDGDTASPGNSMYYGTDSGGTKGWGALPSGATGANPSANVGLSAVNGSATTYMRSDAAPPLNQAIVPTWTGAHIFSSSVALNGAVSTTGGIVVNAATGGGQGAGTINATGLFINGVAVGTGSGSVSSVGVTSTDLSVSGSPITTSGNITLNINAAAVTLAKMANLAANSIIGNNTGSPATPLALTTTQVKTLLAIAYTDVSGLATVAHTGAYSDLTGTPTLLTSPLTTKGDVWGYSTTDARVPVGSNTFVLTADSTAALGVKWAAPTAGTPANPTASVGLTAVNGSATTYMRSDAAPAIDQTISPNWLSPHTFSPSSGIAITINASTGSVGLNVTGGSGAPAISVTAGTGQLAAVFNGTGLVDSVAINSTGRFSDLIFQHAGTLRAQFAWDETNNRAQLSTFNAAATLQLQSGNGVTAITLGGAGNVTIAAPSSGTALTVAGISADTTIDASTASTDAQFSQHAAIASSGGDYPYFGYNLSASAVAGTYNHQVTDTASAIQFLNGTTVIKTAVSGTAGTAITFHTSATFDTNGALSIASPSSAVVALNIAPNAGQRALNIASAAGSQASMQFSIAGTLNAFVGVNAIANDLVVNTQATDLLFLNRTAAGVTHLGTNNAVRLSIDANGIPFMVQPTPTAINATATATIAQLLTLIITSTTAAAVNITLPTGALTDAGILGGTAPTNYSFDWSAINTGGNTLQLINGTNHGIVGSGTIAGSSAHRYRTRKTGAGTFVTYQLS